MASIKHRNGKYQVVIRRKGYAPLYKTSSLLSIARKRITMTEALEQKLLCLRHESGGAKGHKISASARELVNHLLIRCSATFLLCQKTRNRIVNAAQF